MKQQSHTTVTYKDSVFCLLFNDKDRLIELYNALQGTSYDNTVSLEVQTLEDAIFSRIKNDLAFTIDGRFVVLIEHQASKNFNMPLRFLLYIARIYDNIINTRKIYGEAVVKIPLPEFYVFYNGTKDLPEKQILRLSDAYEKPDGSEVALELTCTLYNVNYEKGAELLAKCRTLSEYSQFIAIVRNYLQQGFSQDAAIRQAITICKDKGILAEFLKQHEKEVSGMLFRELTEEEAKEIYFENGFDSGREQGLEQGRELGLEQGRELGIEQGRELGIEQGLEKVAAAMKAKGISPAEIVELTGLPLEKVTEL